MTKRNRGVQVDDFYELHPLETDVRGHRERIDLDLKGEHPEDHGLTERELKNRDLKTEGIESVKDKRRKRRDDQDWMLSQSPPPL